MRCSTLSKRSQKNHNAQPFPPSPARTRVAGAPGHLKDPVLGCGELGHNALRPLLHQRVPHERAVVLAGGQQQASVAAAPVEVQDALGVAGQLLDGRVGVAEVPQLHHRVVVVLACAHKLRRLAGQVGMAGVAEQ